MWAASHTCFRAALDFQGCCKHCRPCCPDCRLDTVVCSGMGLPPPGTSAQPVASGQLSTAEQARQAAALLAQMAGHAGSSSQADQRTAAEALRRMARAPGPSLGQLLNTETLQELLALPGMLDTLGEHLPEQQRTPEGLRGVAGSAALRHQVGRGAWLL